MFGNYEGWHRTSGYCVYVEDGLVTKCYPLTDGDVKMEVLKRPCRIEAFKARIWRKKKKADAVERR